MPLGVRVRLPPCVPYQKLAISLTMFFLIHKPSGVSSFKAIKEFGKKYKFNTVGHTGTLDPLASGALLVATDSDTKLINYISDKTKSYEAVGIFG